MSDTHGLILGAVAAPAVVLLVGGLFHRPIPRVSRVPYRPRAAVRERPG